MVTKPDDFISIILPIFNESGTIHNFIEQISLISAQSFQGFEIIAVNDGSTDNSHEILLGTLNSTPNLRIVNLSKNVGYGGAIRRGISHSRGNKILYIDSDGQYDPHDIPKFISLLDCYDLVIGRRTNRIEGQFRLFFSKTWSFITQMAMRFQATDVNCGLKAFSKALGEALSSDSALISAELISKAKKEGLLIHEQPVLHYPRKMGSPTGLKPRVICQALKEFLQTAVLRLKPPSQ